jgi:hypothetical protein
MTEKKVARNQQQVRLLSIHDLHDLLQTIGIHPSADVDVADLCNTDARESSWQSSQFQLYLFDAKYAWFDQHSVTRRSDSKQYKINEAEPYKFQKVAAGEFSGHDIWLMELMSLRADDAVISGFPQRWRVCCCCWLLPATKQLPFRSITKQRKSNYTGVSGMRLAAFVSGYSDPG